MTTMEMRISIWATANHLSFLRLAVRSVTYFRGARSDRRKAATALDCFVCFHAAIRDLKRSRFNGLHLPSLG